MHKKSLEKRFDDAFYILSHPDFLAGKAVGGQDPSYVMTYQPTDENKAKKNVSTLAKRLDNAGHSVCTVDLFQLCLEEIQTQFDLEDIYAVEKANGLDRLLETLHDLLDLDEVLLDALKEKIKETPGGKPKMLFLTGIGNVYPFLRSHALLSNLQATVRNLPTLLFYPGDYTGRDWKLFGLLSNSTFYRATHLDTLNLRKI
jgi:hypothetical protein